MAGMKGEMARGQHTREGAPQANGGDRIPKRTLSAPLTRALFDDIHVEDSRPARAARASWPLMEGDDRLPRAASYPASTSELSTASDVSPAHGHRQVLEYKCMSDGYILGEGEDLAHESTRVKEAPRRVREEYQVMFTGIAQGIKGLGKRVYRAGKRLRRGKGSPTLDEQESDSTLTSAEPTVNEAYGERLMEDTHERGPPCSSEEWVRVARDRKAMARAASDPTLAPVETVFVRPRSAHSTPGVFHALDAGPGMNSPAYLHGSTAVPTVQHADEPTVETAETERAGSDPTSIPAAETPREQPADDIPRSMLGLPSSLDLLSFSSFSTIGEAFAPSLGADETENEGHYTLSSSPTSHGDEAIPRAMAAERGRRDTLHPTCGQQSGKPRR